ncbi:uncharacterized protein EV422DRAFT_505174 [Fimicolochytrium jonesii]|uniref:uncharacterized protein n=1 Tax=Fimicolochytrium jonesii TaxID=1396493 RepID=UPI0022FEB871|nr:uncharacterized protein EV422DRAFT_505174 [Fimicolochytrium jonesii]KAI8823151.1 hypothetical protein EV422DRAFT_505174 [Fimicolochytrium jonesii]
MTVAELEVADKLLIANVYRIPLTITVTALRPLTLDFPNQPKIDQLARGIQAGFPIQYQGKRESHDIHSNHPLARFRREPIQEDMTRERQAGRRAPLPEAVFMDLPYATSVPLAVVTKDRDEDGTVVKWLG